MRLEPFLQVACRHGAGRDAFEHGDGLIFLLRWMNAPIAAISRDKLQEAEKSRPLVPIRHRVVANQMPGEDGSLLHELRVGLDPAKAGGRCGQGGTGERDKTVHTNQRLSRDVEDSFGDREIVREIEVLDVLRYRASLSRIARFSSMNRSSLFWNARSVRFART